MNLKVFFFILFIAPIAYLTPVLHAQNQLVGRWTSEDKKGVIEIFEQGGKYYGRLAVIKQPNDEQGHPRTDTKNPNPSLRTQPLLNLVILNNFTYSDNTYTGGTIYDPANGKTYTCKMWLTDAHTLKIRGYVGPFFRTQTWSK